MTSEFPATPPRLNRAMTLIAAALVSAVVIGPIFLLTPLTEYHSPLQRFYFGAQDAALAIAIAFALIAMRGVSAGAKSWSPPPLSARRCLIIAASLIAVCYAGHYLLLSDYDLSRDEQLANFDAWIFSRGRLTWPVAPEYDSLSPAFNELLLLPPREREAWISAYLPVNSMIRAGFDAVADAALVGPLFVGVGALALWRIVRRLWPDDAAALVVALILYAGSAQIVLTGMTAYAMSGHLALNLLWLWLYLMRRPLADAGALFVGFLATGLHQPIFHPLFALPLLILVVLRGERGRAAFFALGYAAIAAFWLAWPLWMSDLVGGPGADQAAGASVVKRLELLLEQFGLSSVEDMWYNLIRLVTWQHILLFPLVALGLAAARRGDGLQRALAASFLLPILVMFAIVAYQGHGWGYRYMHGVLGCAILLAVYGWRGLDWARGDARRVLAATTAITGAMLVFLQAPMMVRFYATYAGVDRAIEASSADIALVDSWGAPFAVDLVLNRPDLSNRPLRMVAEKVSAKDLRDLCRRNAEVLFVGNEALRPIRQLFFRRPEREAAYYRRLRAAADDGGCTVVNGEW